MMAGRWLAMNVAGSKVALRGVPTREPVFKLDATWIDEGEKKTPRSTATPWSIPPRS
jgi:flagellar biosynthesis protein FlhA